MVFRAVFYLKENPIFFRTNNEIYLILIINLNFMQKLQNENLLDRLIRVVLGELFLLLAYFWFGGTLSLVFYILGAIALFTAISGFCPVYKILNFNTLIKYQDKLSKKIIYLFVIILILLPTVGSYYSNFFTKKFFLEDYNRMNNYYKQTLFNTGKDKRSESIENYEKLVIEYKKFDDKYSVYHPYIIKNDIRFNDDLKKVAENFANANNDIYNGNLPELHKKFEEVRPVFQDILKRNDFSMLAVALVDFHDIMEEIIAAADAKNAQLVIDIYVKVDEKLKAVEEAANDDEIKAIRANLDSLLDLAKNNKLEDLSKKAAELKSSFIKVYLKRG